MGNTHTVNHLFEQHIELFCLKRLPLNGSRIGILLRNILKLDENVSIMFHFVHKLNVGILAVFYFILFMNFYLGLLLQFSR